MYCVLVTAEWLFRCNNSGSLQLDELLWHNQHAYRSRKFLEFKIQIFCACKIGESGVGPGKS